METNNDKKQPVCFLSGREGKNSEFVGLTFYTMAFGSPACTFWKRVI